MLEKQRHQRIIDILEEQQYASVQSLTKKLSHSEATIRRDLTKMSSSGSIRKIRGGAESIKTANDASTLDSSDFSVAKQENAEVKRLIAQKAVSLCSPGESIIINGGSSTYMMSEFLSSIQVNILTNSFVLAQHIAEHSDNQVTLPSGEVYRKQGIILSSFERDSLEYYHSDKMFMGTAGIGEYGVMESDPLLIRAEQRLSKLTDKLIILADSSKLNKSSNFIFCPLSDVDTLITDSNADKEMLDLFKSEGIKVEIVNV